MKEIAGVSVSIFANAGQSICAIQASSEHSAWQIVREASEHSAWQIVREASEHSASPAQRRQAK